MSQHGRLPGFTLALACLAAAVVARGQDADDGYHPAANGSVLAIAVQADGKALVGGSFSAINSVNCHALCRLNADGSVDAGFLDSVPDSGINTLALQPDGKILVGGYFSQIGAPVQTRHRLARLNADGSVDTSFADPNIATSVFVLALQADGEVLVSSQSPLSAQLARYDANGNLDPGFSANIDGFVAAIAPQADGKIVIGGYFTMINGAPCHHLCRLMQSGNVDPGFSDPDADNGVSAIALQADGKILVGGNLTTIHSVSCPGICRLGLDGNPDTSFHPATPAGFVYRLAVRPDGKVLVGESVGASGLLVRLLADGSTDPASPAAYTDNAIQALALEADNKLLLGGYFTLIGNVTPTQSHPYLARLDENGNVEASMTSANADNFVTAIAVQPDAKILLGGWFQSIGGAPCPSVCRLQSDGSVDGGFVNAGFVASNGIGQVDALALQPDGKVLVCGDIWTNTMPQRQWLLRLEAGGSLDDAFVDPAADHPVHTIAVQPDGYILIGGNFTTIGQQPRHRIARLKSDGSLDTTFVDPNADSDVYAIALQPDGKILVGGAFGMIGTPQQARKYMARLNSDGSLDDGFAPPNVGGSFVAAFAVQPDGALIVAGFINSVGDDPSRNYVARLDDSGNLDGGFTDPNVDGIVYALGLQPDGRIMIGGAFDMIGTPQHAQKALARLNADGSVDSSFANPNANPSLVLALALQTDGKLMAGGQFTMIGAADPRQRQYLARLSLPDAALQSLDVGPTSTVTWARSAAGPELALPPLLQYSTDLQHYLDIGPMARVAGGWARDAVLPPIVGGQQYYLRALGRVGGGEFDASPGLIESVRIVYATDSIFANGFEP